MQLPDNQRGGERQWGSGCTLRVAPTDCASQLGRGPPRSFKNYPYSGFQRCHSPFPLSHLLWVIFTCYNKRSTPPSRVPSLTRSHLSLS